MSPSSRFDDVHRETPISSATKDRKGRSTLGNVLRDFPFTTLFCETSSSTCYQPILLRIRELNTVPIWLSVALTLIVLSSQAESPALSSPKTTCTPAPRPALPHQHHPTRAPDAPWLPRNLSHPEPLPLSRGHISRGTPPRNATPHCGPYTLPPLRPDI